jgi:tetratricopeptide (TPR) repeat protein
MKLPKPRMLVLLILLIVLGGGAAGYWILLSPGSIWVRWARAAFPARITMITFGPCPSAAELRSFRERGGKYVVSLLDPRLPYERELIKRERTDAGKIGLIVKDFPMASIFDRRIFSDYADEEQDAVNFLKHLDGPAYVHCYLGKHRVIHVRNALRKAGVPASYWTPTGSRKQYWELVNRLADARREFQKKNYAQVIMILDPVTAKDVDLADLRGWSHYHMGLFTEAATDFKAGLSVDPLNPRDLEGLGYCYLQQGDPVMAQRAFSLVLTQEPRNEGALAGQGLAFLALRNRSSAAEMFRQVLSLDPGNDEAKNGLKRAQSESRSIP